MLNKYTLPFFISLLLISKGAYSQTDNYEKALQAYNSDDFNSAHIYIKNALKQKPNNLPAKLLLAKVLIEKNQYQLAEQELKETLTQGADINLVIQPLGKSLLLQSKFDQALNFFNDKKLSQQGELARNLIKAEAYQGLEEVEKAKNKYHSILAKYPNNLNANLGLASLHLTSNSTEQVPQLLKKIALLDSNNSKLFIYKGILARKNGDLNKALQFFKKSNEIESNNIVAYRGLANCYLDLKQFEQANKYLDKILAISPKDPQAQLMKSSSLSALNKNDTAIDVLNTLTNQLSSIDKVYLQSQPQLLLIDSITSYRQKNWEQARQKFQIYLEQNNDDVNATVLLADVYIKLNQAEKALSILEDKESKLITNKEQALILAGLYLQFNKTFKAEYLLSKLRDLYKGDAKILIVSAKIMSERGQLTKAIQMLETLSFPNDSSYNYTLALLYFQSAQFNKSLEKVKLIIDLAPDNVDYQLLHSHILKEIQQHKAAQLIIEDLYNKHPKNRDVLLSYVSLQTNLGNHKAAKQILKALVSQDSNDGSSWLLLADIEYNLGNIKDAINILESQTRNSDFRTDALLKLADLHFKEQQYEKSLVVINSALNGNRLNTDAIEIKFKNLLALNRIKEAKHQTKILKGLWSDNALDLFKLSQLQQQIQNYPEAEKNLARAITLAPNALPIYISSIKLKIRLKKLTDASTLLKTARRKGYKNDINIIILSGDIAKANNQMHKAFSYYQQALQQDDSNIIALIKLTKSSNTPKLSKQFSELLFKLVKQYPERNFQRNTFADYLMVNNKYAQAKFQYQQLLTRNIPSDTRAIALNNLAVIYLDEKDYDSAVEFSAQAVSILGSVAAIVDTRGWSLTLSGEPEQGLTFLRQAYTMSSSSPDIQYHIAYTLAQLNRQSEARTLLTQVVAMPDNFPEHKMAKRLLNELK